jgi:predicted acyltransferase
MKNIAGTEVSGSEQAPNPPPHSPLSSRLDSIDIFRGLAILGMVLANYLAGVEWISPWFKHARDVGYTVIDLVAPMFIFAIGLTYGLSFHNRIRRNGTGKTYQHFILRFAALLGLGALFSAGEILLQVDNTTINWGVLQAIGVAGLVALIFIRTPTWVRLAAGVIILTGYQFLLDHFWLSTILSNPHGGLLGSISWSGMLLLGTVLADIFFTPGKGLKRLILTSFGTVALTLLLALWLPISKNRVSVSYVLLSLGLSGLLFGACHILVQRFHLRSHLLVLWGRNPLVMYLLHLVLIGLVFLPDIPAIYEEAPAWLVIVEAITLLGGLTWVAWWMDKKKIYFSL